MGGRARAWSRRFAGTVVQRFRLSGRAKREWRGMQYREIAASEDASEIVERIWSLELDTGDAGHVQRVVPDGNPELILHLAEPLESFESGEWRRQPATFLAGQITGPLLLRASGAARVL